MAGGHATKEISKRYPIVKGLTAETTKQTGRRMDLKIERKSLVKKSRKAGIYA